MTDQPVIVDMDARFQEIQEQFPDFFEKGILVDEWREIEDLGRVRFFLSREKLQELPELLKMLAAVRQLPTDVSSIDRNHPKVVEYVLRNVDEEEQEHGKIPPAMYEDAAGVIRIDVQNQLSDMQGSALLILALDGMFEMKQVGKSVRVALKKEITAKIEVPSEYWNREKINERRTFHGLPELPRLWKNNPLEQKIAFINQMQLEFPEFRQIASNMLSEGLMNSIAPILYEAMQGASEETDDGGFPPN